MSNTVEVLGSGNQPMFVFQKQVGAVCRKFICGRCCIQVIVFFVLFMGMGGCCDLFSLFADETRYKDARDQMIRVPNDSTYFSVLGKFGGQITRDEQKKLWGEMLKLQNNPSVLCKELLVLYRAKKGYLRDVKITYSESVEIKPGSNRGAPGHTFRDYVFALSGLSNLYLERHGERWDGDYWKSIISSDGEVLITVDFHKGDLTNANVTKITSPDYLRMFFQVNMPLFRIGFFSETTCGYPVFYDRNLISNLEQNGSYFVLQQEESINGKKTIVVFDQWSRYNLAVDMDFSIVKFEFFEPIYDKSDASLDIRDRRIVGRCLNHQSVLSEHIDCGNGVWIPGRIEESDYLSDGRQHCHTIIITKDIQVNKKLPDSFFTNVIPDDAYVADGVNELVYKQSDSASINSLIKETAKSKRILIFRYISIISGIVLIIIALVMKYRQYRKNKRENKNRTEEKK